MMKLGLIHCFLVHPGKGVEQPPPIGGVVPLNGQPYTMLNSIFDRAESDCPIEIAFNHNAAGKQQNDSRDAILKYVSNRTEADGRAIAERLQAVTTQKPGLGLLFLLSAGSSGEHKLVISRFPADQGILAEEAKNKLSVEFLEKVFMKSLTAYKAVVYSGQPTDFWLGRAVDKQFTAPGEIAQYWVRSFLLSELRTTPAAGTKRLAEAIRSAMQASTDTDTKAELAAAVTLAGNLDGQLTSVELFCDQFGLSDQAATSIMDRIRPESLATERFQFDVDELKKHVPLKTIEMDNGAMLTADLNKFPEVFTREDLVDGVRFSTQGRIVDERLPKRRA